MILYLTTYCWHTWQQINIQFLYLPFNFCRHCEKVSAVHYLLFHCNFVCVLCYAHLYGLKVFTYYIIQVPYVKNKQTIMHNTFYYIVACREVLCT